MAIRLDWDRVIQPVHPDFPLRVTVRDCKRFAASSGLSPQLIAGFIMGRVKPAEHAVQRLKMVFDPDVVDRMVADYQPLRFYDIHKKLPYRARYDHFYPVVDLHPGDAIELSGVDGWLIVSDSYEYNNTVRIFSGGVLCAVVPAATRLNVARATSNEGKSELREHVKKEQKKGRLDVVGEVMGMTVEERKQIVEDLIKQMDAR